MEVVPANLGVQIVDSIEHNNPELLERLLASILNEGLRLTFIRESDLMRDPLIHLAVRFQSEGAVGLLLHNGASAGDTNRYGVLALTLAESMLRDLEGQQKEIAKREHSEERSVSDALLKAMKEKVKVAQKIYDTLSDDFYRDR
jgi:hypothetical protein